jgi:hypothetical protein
MLMTATMTTLETVRTGEVCSVCGEEMVLDPTLAGEVEIGCGCSCASALA